MMNSSPHRISDVVFAAVGGFITGVFLVAFVLLQFREVFFPLMIDSNDLTTASNRQQLVVQQPAGGRNSTTPSVPGDDAGDAVLRGSPASHPRARYSVGATDIGNLRKRNLDLPVKNLDREKLADSFEDARGSNRRHEAMDILADRNTPVLAVEDGKIVRLWWSDNGGHTIYQFDPTNTYVYYYAHLDRYADNLKDGDTVRKGQVIGYVGTSGNAPENAPHLHFAIFKLTEEKHWWEGDPINPFKIYQ